MHIFFLRRLFVTSLSFSYSQAWPLSKLWTRQGLTLDVCADPKAVPDANCFNLANVPDYLNNPNTGWIHTTPTCVDSTKCCIPDDDGWTTCFLRLALPASGQDCTTLNDHPCTAQAVLDPNLAPSILPQVRYTVMSIYGVHGFFAQYFDSRLFYFDFDAYQLTIDTIGLNMAYAQALSVITDMTLLLDPDKTASISIFAVLSALTVGLAFLTVSSLIPETICQF